MCLTELRRGFMQMGFAGTLASGWTDWIIADVSHLIKSTISVVELTRAQLACCLSTSNGVRRTVEKKT